MPWGCGTSLFWASPFPFCSSADHFFCGKKQSQIPPCKNLRGGSLFSLFFYLRSIIHLREWKREREGEKHAVLIGIWVCHIHTETILVIRSFPSTSPLVPFNLLSLPSLPLTYPCRRSRGQLEAASLSSPFFQGCFSSASL